MNLISVLESVIFVSGDEGLSLKQIIEILDQEEENVLKLINILKEEYNQYIIPDTNTQKYAIVKSLVWS